MKLIDYYKKYAKTFYISTLITLLAVTVIGGAIEVGRHGFSPGVRWLWSGFVFKNPAIDVSIAVVVASPVTYLFLQKLARFFVPMEDNIIVQVAKVKRALAVLLGMSMGLLILLLFLLASNNPDGIDIIILALSILFAATVSLINFTLSHAPRLPRADRT